MARSSILGGEKAPAQASGRDTDALGPSDSSDSGSDVQGTFALNELDDGLGADSDAGGTGERASVEGHVRDGADIGPDRIGRFGGDALDTDDQLSLDALAESSNAEAALTDVAELSEDDGVYDEEDQDPDAPDPGVIDDAPRSA